MPHHDGKQAEPLYPPESMAAGQGIGFAAVTYLQGGEKVLPELMRLIRAADGDLPWAKDWTPADLAYLQAQLTPYFTKEGLTSQASVVFQPNGTTVEMWRPARSNWAGRPGRSGWEVITVNVRATHAGKPVLGRVADATLEVMPSAFAGQGGDDTIGTALNVNAGVNGLLALGVDRKVKGLGFLLQGAWARSVSETTTAGVTGFSLQAMLYVGKARLFTYKDVKYHLKVTVRHEKNVKPGVSDFLGEAGLDTAAEVASTVEDAIETASDAVSVRRRHAPAGPPSRAPSSVFPTTVH